jgi:hypothetical protein
MATEVGKGLKRLHQARLQEQEVYAELYSLYDACAEREEQGLPPEPIAHAALAQKIQEVRFFVHAYPIIHLHAPASPPSRFFASFSLFLAGVSPRC